MCIEKKFYSEICNSKYVILFAATVSGLKGVRSVLLQDEMFANPCANESTFYDVDS